MLPNIEIKHAIYTTRLQLYLFLFIITFNMLIGVETPRGSVHSAYSSSAHPRGAITTYHVFSMCAYKIDITI